MRRRTSVTLMQLLNWYVGWSLLLCAFVTGAALGLFFHRQDFLGGYTSFRRRIVRLGHIALAALGMLNVLFSYASWPTTSEPTAQAASAGFAIGGIPLRRGC